MYWVTLLSLGFDESYFFTPVSFLIFFGTLCIYNVFRLIGLKKQHLDQDAILMSWISSNKLLVIILAYAAGFAFVFFFFSVPTRIQVAFVIIAIISITYAFPLLPGRSKFFRLREVGLFKTIIVAIVWMFSTALIPCLIPNNPDLTSIVLLCSSRFLFILGITIPFDIRDLKYDEKDQLKTIAGKLGISRTKQLSIAILIVSALITIVYASLGHSFVDSRWVEHLSYTTYISVLTAANLAAIAIAIFIISRLSSGSNEYNYTFGLDGTMILHFVLIDIGLKLSLLLF